VSGVSQEIIDMAQGKLDVAINKTKPVAINGLFSGGFDSMIAIHLAHRLNTHGIPLKVWAVDTNLAADGWHEFVKSVATKYGWDFEIYNNVNGFGRFLAQVAEMGLPRTKKGHKYTMNKLKGVAFSGIHALTKTGKVLKIPPNTPHSKTKKIYQYNKVDTKAIKNNKTIFITGMRRDESPDRESIPILQRYGTSNFYWLALIADFSEGDCFNYRIENDLPDNPFYDTVKGSGDCQCNWGDFISYETLKRFSPILAQGNVKVIDFLNRHYHETTWDHKSTNQLILPTLDGNYKEPCELTSPFLCQGCSRKKSKPTKKQVEQRYLQTKF
jgi:3'-phosphoadenosine 5'-phosphosulfate sulfotransferase (PAPS reductase)/FAD synthetase